MKVYVRYTSDYFQITENSLKDYDIFLLILKGCKQYTVINAEKFWQFIDKVDDYDSIFKYVKGKPHIKFTIKTGTAKVGGYPLNSCEEKDWDNNLKAIIQTALSCSKKAEVKATIPQYLKNCL
ncbi:MAG: hypothetical protein AB7E48_11035 [Deferribacterales bacterium]